MFTRGYAKPPCTRLAYIHGLAVDRVRPYPFNHKRTEEPRYTLSPLGIIQGISREAR